MDESALEIERSLVGHFIGEIPEDFSKPVAYILQRDGLWERRTNPLGIFCRKMAEASVPGLPATLKEGFELCIPRMPTAVLWEAIAFFRSIYSFMGTESVVRVIYDRKRGGFETECPKQTVGRVRVRFEKRPLPRHKLLVAEIHSHAGFDARFSGTDDADELGDRFYGVIGRLDEAFPEVAFRLSVGGKKIRIPLGSLFDLGADPVFSCSFPRSWLKHVSLEPRPPRPAGGGCRGFFPEDEQFDLLGKEWEDESSEESDCWFMPDDDGAPTPEEAG
jgi:PRTRC genetic system protein A